MTETPIPLVIGGPSASGKTTVARGLADFLDRRAVDADDHHPPANVARMSAGAPLTDEHRRPWLDTLASLLAEDPSIVLACSALRRTHRDRLRRAGPMRFVLLLPSPEEARRRAEQRSGHFMPADLVASQFATLELPTDDEPDVAVVAVDGRTPSEVLADVVGTLDLTGDA